MKRAFFLATALSLATLPALAEQPDPAQDFGAEFDALYGGLSGVMGNLRHATEAAKAFAASQRRDRETIAALRKEKAELDVYLKACGDKPGCTAPAPSQ